MNRFHITSKIFVNKDTEQALFVGYRSYLAMAVGLDQMAGQHVFYVVNQENPAVDEIRSLMGTGEDFRESFGLIRSQQTRGLPTQDEIERLYFELWIDAHLGVDHQCWKGLLDRMQSSFNLDMSKIAKIHIEEQAFSGMAHVEPKSDIELAEDSTDELDQTADEYVTPPKHRLEENECSAPFELSGFHELEMPLTDEELKVKIDPKTGEVTYQSDDEK